MQFAFGKSETVGRRNYQEDASYAAFLSPADYTILSDGDRASAKALVAILADGMGGHVGGREASTLACQSFCTHLLSGAETDQPSLSDRMLAALHASNKAIADRVTAQPELAGMGCTLVGVVFDQRGVAWTSVGDSLLYLHRKGHLYRLNADHSLQPVLDDLVKRGEMSADEARRHPQRNALRSAVTGQTIELTDQSDDAHPLQPGDWVVLASDGLLTLSYSQIVQVIRSHGAAGPQAVADKLIAAVEAADRPNQDNTTIVCVQVSASPAPSVRTDGMRAAHQGQANRPRTGRRSPATMAAAIALGTLSLALAYGLWVILTPPPAPGTLDQAAGGKPSQPSGGTGASGSITRLPESEPSDAEKTADQAGTTGTKPGPAEPPKTPAQKPVEAAQKPQKPAEPPVVGGAGEGSAAGKPPAQPAGGTGQAQSGQSVPASRP